MLWRIARASYSSLDDEGARLYGARWSSQGMAVVYTASHLSLAALEYLVHIDPEDAPDDLVALGLQIPEQASQLVCGPSDLPAGWWQTPPPPECQEVGDRWIREGQHLLFRVPSVLVPEEEIVLMNPGHPEARGVRIAGSRPFSFDPRLSLERMPTPTRAAPPTPSAAR